MAMVDLVFNYYLYGADMDLNILSPYIRVAMHSTLGEHHHLKQRVIYDYELICISGGEGDIRIGGTVYRVKDGDAVLIRPGVEHEFIGVGVPLYQPHIHFDPVYDEYSQRRRVSFRDISAMSEDERRMIQADILFPDQIPCVFTPMDIGAFRNRFFKIIEIFRAKEKNYAVRYMAEMLRLLDMIFRQFNCYGEEQSKGYSIIAAVKEYIDNNSDKVITLDGLSAQFYMNKYTLMRNFADRYGTTVIAYYNSKRVESAKELLLNTDLSISSISEEMGFTDIYTFSRFFKNATGISPTKFRK